MEQIQSNLGVGKWQSKLLAGFSLGVMATRRYTLSIVGWLGKADSVDRRIQRWLDNERIDSEACQRAWASWVLSYVDTRQRLTLLVDETKLSTHMNAMVVGLAYQRRCLVLAWRCYAPDDWPEGQARPTRRCTGRSGSRAGHIP